MASAQTGRPAANWLKLAVRRIAAKVKPKKIILFGSHAYGRPGKDSDIDLLVVVDGPGSREKRYRWVDKAIGEHLWPVDILVRRSAEVEERLRIGDSFIQEIVARGKVLYES